MLKRCDPAEFTIRKRQFLQAGEPPSGSTVCSSGETPPPQLFHRQRTGSGTRTEGNPPNGLSRNRGVDNPVLSKIINAGEFLIFNDNQFFHYTSPITALPFQEGVRDVFVLTSPGLLPPAV